MFRILSGVTGLIANHLPLALFESAPEVRALCSAGITRPQRSNDPVRLPPWPSPDATLRPLPSPATGLPLYPRTTLSTCCSHYPGGLNGCACRFLPRSCCIPPKGAHNVGSLAFEVAVSYPFHPFVGKSVLVVGEKEHAGTRHLIIRGPDGAK